MLGSPSECFYRCPGNCELLMRRDGAVQVVAAGDDRG